MSDVNKVMAYGLTKMSQLEEQLADVTARNRLMLQTLDTIRQYVGSDADASLSDIADKVRELCDKKK
jgi:hypothetical protein